MSCQHSCIVNAPADSVWATLRNFHDMDWAKAVLPTCEKVGDTGAHEVGAMRLLNGVFTETLRGLDDANKTLRYSIDSAPGTPVDAATDFLGTVQVRPGDTDGTAVVNWSAQWSSSEGGVAEFCDPVYAALLGELQKRFG
jgi:carbon monoxide dehydrogenase subunit G